MSNYDHDEVERQLKNWGLSVRDDWHNHLGYTPPPTSEHYMAPISIHDEPEVREQVDESCANLANHVIIALGTEPGWFDHFRAIVKWYTRLLFHECSSDERILRLSKHLKCNRDTARSMLRDAQRAYWDRRLVVDGLKREFRLTRGL